MTGKRTLLGNVILGGGSDGCTFFKHCCDVTLKSLVGKTPTKAVNGLWIENNVFIDIIMYLFLCFSP